MGSFILKRHVKFHAALDIQKLWASNYFSL